MQGQREWQKQLAPWSHMATVCFPSGSLQHRKLSVCCALWAIHETHSLHICSSRRHAPEWGCVLLELLRAGGSCALPLQSALPLGNPQVLQNGHVCRVASSSGRMNEFRHWWRYRRGDGPHGCRLTSWGWGAPSPAPRELDKIKKVRRGTGRGMRQARRSTRCPVGHSKPMRQQRRHQAASHGQQSRGKVDQARSAAATVGTVGRTRTSARRGPAACTTRNQQPAHSRPRSKTPRDTTSRARQPAGRGNQRGERCRRACLDAVGAGNNADVHHVKEQAVVDNALQRQDGRGGCSAAGGTRCAHGRQGAKVTGLCGTHTHTHTHTRAHTRTHARAYAHKRTHAHTDTAAERRGRSSVTGRARGVLVDRPPRPPAAHRPGHP